MTHPIRVVVTCTQSKSAPVHPSLLARELDKAGAVSKRLREWRKRVEARKERGIQIRDLYQGDHWTVALGIQAPKSVGEVDLRVASAGYGLLELQDRVQPYGASFRTGDEDSVARSGEDATRWWAALAGAKFPGIGSHARTLAELVEEDPRASLVVVVSPPYLAALSDDIGAASEAIYDQDRLVIISAGARSVSASVSRHLLDVDARLQGEVGGSMVSLNVRIAQDLLKRRRSEGVSLTAAQSSYRRIQDQLDKFQYPDRARLSDAEVLQFIEKKLGANPSASRTGLLKQLRGSGHACEQARFAQLFEQAKVTLYD
jgi:hypothetical protein